MNKKIIMDYISNLIEKDKELSNFDESYKSISKSVVLRDIINKFNLKHADAFRYCSFFDFKNNG